jgi:hypothetical protein
MAQSRVERGPSAVNDDWLSMICCRRAPSATGPSISHSLHSSRHHIFLPYPDLLRARPAKFSCVQGLVEPGGKTCPAASSSQALQSFKKRKEYDHLGVLWPSPESNGVAPLTNSSESCTADTLQAQLGLPYCTRCALSTPSFLRLDEAKKEPRLPHD